MANLRDIKRRIRSVTGTQQITRAMKMVAAAKLRRNQDRLIRLRPFSDGIATLLARFLPNSIGDEHPLLVSRESVRKRLIIVVTGDKGLCGAFNQNIMKRAHYVFADSPGGTPLVLTIGRKGHMAFRREGGEIMRHYEDIYDKISFTTARTIAQDVEDVFVSGDVDEVLVVYSHFVSPIEQRITSFPVLPLKIEHIRESAGREEDIRPGAGDAGASGTGAKPRRNRAARDIEIPSEDEREVYLFEPDIVSLCNDLLSRYLASEIFRAILENVASEFGARMTAMENATDNASDLIDTLTLKYNRARQTSITREILEVSSGAEAMKDG
ncbi:MAG: ATP synthase F1 subunit gamma [Planctomycetes bacterium]|nr:ATP synthase F1 subunit gamma [Planctomycetota bacterium]